MTNAFQLGDLVLAKFDEYPYWPAVVQKCFWRDGVHRGRWRLVDTAGNTTKLWCSFVEDDTANWVPLEKVKTFTPKAARRWQCRRRTRNFEAQQKAIEAAEKLYALRIPKCDEGAASASDHTGSSLSGTTGPRSASPSSFGSSDGVRSLGKQICSDTSGHILISDCKTFPAAPDLGTGRKRLYPHSEVDIPSSKIVKMENRVAPASMVENAHTISGEIYNDLPTEINVAQTRDQSRTVSSRKIRIKVEWIEEYKQSQAFAEIAMRHSLAGMNDLNAHQGKQMPSEEFINVMQQLRRSFSTFKNGLEECSFLRQQIQDIIGEKETVLEQLHDELGTQEARAGEDLIGIINILERLAQASIALDDLRKLRAGKLITSVMKNCGEISLIKSLCSKIVLTWREQCRIYDEQQAAMKFNAS